MQLNTSVLQLCQCTVSCCDSFICNFQHCLCNWCFVHVFAVMMSRSFWRASFSNASVVFKHSMTFFSSAATVASSSAICFIFDLVYFITSCLSCCLPLILFFFWRAHIPPAFFSRQLLAFSASPDVQLTHCRWPHSDHVLVNLDISCWATVKPYSICYDLEANLTLAVKNRNYGPLKNYRYLFTGLKKYRTITGNTGHASITVFWSAISTILTTVLKNVFMTWRCCCGCIWGMLKCVHSWYTHIQIAKKTHCRWPEQCSVVRPAFNWSAAAADWSLTIAKMEVRRVSEWAVA